MRRPLVVGNWKMNGTRPRVDDLLNQIISRLSDEIDAEIAVCVPFVYIPSSREKIAESNLFLGSQNVGDRDNGAFTGEVSAAMLAEFDCRFSIVGHSERRHLYNESNELVAARFHQAISKRIEPILCVGETLEQRNNNDTFKVIDQQLISVIDRDGIDSFKKCVVAYEPVWAIGTGKTATTEQAQEVHAHIRKTISGHDPIAAEDLRILYGGSVNPENAKALFSMKDIDGGLIGGASLDAKSFLAIANSATTVK